MNENEIIKIKETIKTAGFDQKTCSIYLSLLRLGKGTVTEITRDAKVGRTYGYPILNMLVSKGLVSASGKNPKQEYFAESPRNLYAYLEKELEEKNKNIKRVKEIIPDLIRMHNVEDRPKIRFYEGIDGLKEVYDDTLTAHDSIVAYATYEDMHNAMPGYFEKYYKRRASKGISARGIVPATPMAYERQKNNTAELRSLMLVPIDKYLFSPDIEIYDNKVMVASWREKLGIIIESGEIADAMKKIFELAWIGAETIEKTKKTA